MKTLTSICVVAVSALAILNAPEALPISDLQSPTVNLAPTQLEFVRLGSCPAVQKAVTLTNDGPRVLDIRGIAITQGTFVAFTQSHTCGSTLGVGESCSITVTWRGELGSEDNGSLFVTDNGVGSPQTVSLRGFCLQKF